MPNELRKAKFYLDGLEGVSFEGYTLVSGKNRWNGWAIPYFTKEVADKIAERFMSETNDVVRYRKDLDAYLAVLQGSSDIEQFDAETINGMKLYSLGGGSWTWAEEEEIDSEAFEQHLHDSIERMDLFGADPKNSDVKIEFEGKAIELPMNADLYEALVRIMREETEFKKLSGGNER